MSQVSSERVPCARCNKSAHSYLSSANTKSVRKRTVPPFSAQSLQKNTKVIEPNAFMKGIGIAVTAKKILSNFDHFVLTARIDGTHSRARSKTIPSTTSFRMYYDRGDLPIKMEYFTGGEKISWLADINKLDYSLYLPLFFDGLSETKHPYKTYARQGVRDLLNSGGDKIHAVIPQLIIPIKSAKFNILTNSSGDDRLLFFPFDSFLDALNTKNHEVMCVTLKILQHLVQSSDLVGPALVPFYRQLLPMFNMFRVKNGMANCE